MNPLHDRLLSQMSFVSLVWSLQEILRPCFKLFCGRMSCHVLFHVLGQISDPRIRVPGHWWLLGLWPRRGWCADPWPRSVSGWDESRSGLCSLQGQDHGFSHGFCTEKMAPHFIWLIILPSKNTILSICKYITWINIGVYGKSYPGLSFWRIEQPPNLTGE